MTWSRCLQVLRLQRLQTRTLAWARRSPSLVSPSAVLMSTTTHSHNQPPPSASWLRELPSLASRQTTVCMTRALLQPRSWSRVLPHFLVSKRAMWSPLITVQRPRPLPQRLLILQRLCHSLASQSAAPTTSTTHSPNQPPRPTSPPKPSPSPASPPTTAPTTQQPQQPHFSLRPLRHSPA